MASARFAVCLIVSLAGIQMTASATGSSVTALSPQMRWVVFTAIVLVYLVLALYLCFGSPMVRLVKWSVGARNEEEHGWRLCIGRWLWLVIVVVICSAYLTCVFNMSRWLS